MIGSQSADMCVGAQGVVIELGSHTRVPHTSVYERTRKLGRKVRGQSTRVPPVGVPTQGRGERTYTLARGWLQVWGYQV